MAILNDPAEWDAVSADYETINEPFMGRFVDEALARITLNPHHAVLDVAAGPGTVAARVAPRVRHVTATDYAPGMIAALRQRVERDGLSNITVAQMDGQNLELPDASFDWAFSAFGLIFFPDRMRGFRELWRVLRPGGHAVVLSWGSLAHAPLLTRVFELVRERVPELPPAQGPPPMMSLSDPAKFASEMRQAGFEPVTVESALCTQVVGENLDAMWDGMSRAHAFLVAVRKLVGESRFGELRGYVLGQLQEMQGPGPVSVTAEAHIGIGHRP